MEHSDHDDLGAKLSIEHANSQPMRRATMSNRSGDISVHSCSEEMIFMAVDGTAGICRGPGPVQIDLSASTISCSPSFRTENLAISESRRRPPCGHPVGTEQPADSLTRLRTILSLRSTMAARVGARPSP